MTSSVLSSPDQARELFREISTLIAHKGRMLGQDEYWRGDRLALTNRIRERAGCTVDDAKDYHIGVIKRLGGSTTGNELAVVTFTSPNTQQIGFAALRYTLMGIDDSPFTIECHEVENLLPKIPTEAEVRYEGYNATPTMNTADFTDDPAAFTKGMLESAMVNAFHYDIEATEKEAKARDLGKFATSSSEADELISIVRNFVEF